MNHIEIKHLRLLRAISESGNMTRAAEKLCITQSALSQQLKDIESKLGTDLFSRTRKKMVLTRTGKQLLQIAEQVIEVVDTAELEIARRVSGERGELKVGTQCIFCYKWLPQVLSLFHRKFPNVNIEIGNSADLAEELETKKYDLIISGAISPDETHTSIPLFQDQLVCIMATDNPLAAGGFIRLEDFSRYNLISHAEKSRNRFYQQTLKPRGIEPKRIMNVGAPQAIIELVVTGFGIGIFPRWAIQEALQTYQLSACPIGRSGLPLTWHAVFPTHANMPVYQKEFINNIRNLNVTGQIVAKDSLASALR
jgi:LysR family transcriptional regulator, regulator for metE and metH